MPRNVTVSLSQTETDRLVEKLRNLDGLLTLQLMRGASVYPAGDVVSFEVSDKSLPTVMRMLDELGSGVNSDISVSMTEPTGMVSASGRKTVMTDPASSTFEEMQFVLSRESTMRFNKLVVMALAGVVATIGIATNATHIVVAAMVIAPGFEPPIRVALGAVSGRATWKFGVLDTIKGYGALIGGALVTGLLLPLLGVTIPEGEAGYVRNGILISYWQEVTVSGTVLTIAAGIAGALLIAANRSVLTAGVMIALALIPHCRSCWNGLGNLGAAGCRRCRAALAARRSDRVCLWTRRDGR